MRWVEHSTPRPLYTQERDSIPIVHEAGWTPGLVWTGVENLASIGIRSPNHPALANRLSICENGKKFQSLLLIYVHRHNVYVTLSSRTDWLFFYFRQ